MLSESISKALQLTGGEDAEGTANFVMMFDKFFDCLNVTNFTNGAKARKPFQKPYTNSDDIRLKVSKLFINITLAHLFLIVARRRLFRLSHVLAEIC